MGQVRVTHAHGGYLIFIVSNYMLCLYEFPKKGDDIIVSKPLQEYYLLYSSIPR